MTSLSKIVLTNFRGHENAEFALAPLTVLVGPNGAGKSSFGQAVACLAHTHRETRSSGKQALSPARRDDDQWPVDLGPATELRTSGTSGPIVVTLTTSDGEVAYGFDAGPDDDRPVLMQIVVPLTPTTSQSKISLATTRQAGDEAGAHAVTTSGFAPTGAAVASQKSTFVRREEGRWIDQNDRDALLGFSGLELMTIQHAAGTAVVFNSVATKSMARLLESIVYLRPSRSPARRSYPLGGDPRTVGYDGANLINVLAKRGGDRVSFPDIRGPYDSIGAMQTARQRSADSIELSLREAVVHWLTYLGLADDIKVETHQDRQTLLARTADAVMRPLHDLGFGLSQVAPIITAALGAPKQSQIILDLPEAHLHPATLGSLCDFLAAMTLNGQHFLIETHSRGLVRRLQNLSRLHPALKDKLAVYCVDPPSEGRCQSPKSMIRPEDESLSWPVGLLEDNFWEGCLDEI